VTQVGGAAHLPHRRPSPAHERVVARGGTTDELGARAWAAAATRSTAPRFRPPHPRCPPRTHEASGVWDAACRAKRKQRRPPVHQRARDIKIAIDDGFDSKASDSPVSANPRVRYNAAAGSDPLSWASASLRRCAPASRAQPATASRSAWPTPPRRAFGSTHIPQRTAAARCSSGKNPPAIPRLRPRSTATKIAPVVAAALSATRSFQKAESSAASRANQDENA
jgi:hypothetical protein